VTIVAYFVIGVCLLIIKLIIINWALVQYMYCKVEKFVLQVCLFSLACSYLESP